MPFLAPLLGPAFAAIGGGSAASGALTAASTGASAVSGFLGGRGRNDSSSTSSSGSRSESATSKQVLTPEQLQILQAIAPQILGQIQDPGEGLEPIRTAGRNAVNESFSGADQAIRNRFLGKGNVQRSGKANRAALSTDLARRSGLARVESDIGALKLERQDRSSDLGLRLLGIPFETATTGNVSTEGASQGQGRFSGNRAGGALDSGLETAATLTTLDRLLRRPDAQPQANLALRAGNTRRLAPRVNV